MLTVCVCVCVMCTIIKKGAEKAYLLKVNSSFMIILLQRPAKHKMDLMCVCVCVSVCVCIRVCVCKDMFKYLIYVFICNANIHYLYGAYTHRKLS